MENQHLAPDREPQLPAKLLARAKLNLDLRIVGVREDGYHLVNTTMVTIDLSDTVEIVAGEGLQVEYSHNLEPVGCPLDENNLVYRALNLVGIKARVKLSKNIPIGAGLGGGSADAAAIFRWAKFFNHERAAELGADIPFLIRGGRSEATGIGNKLNHQDHKAGKFTLMVPPIRCDTAAVYHRWDQMNPSGPASGERPAGLINDLEPAAIDLYPELADWRDRLASQTGLIPVMTGTGSAFFVKDHHQVTIDGANVFECYATPQIEP